MKTFEVAIGKLKEAPWNANQMNEAMYNRLKESLRSYGLVQPLVVRPVTDSNYEVLSGNQRLKVIRELGFTLVSCVVIDLNDHDAMLLAQALNAIHGSDDPSRKSNVLKTILSVVPNDKVISLLPETVESLKSLSTLGQQDLSAHLKAWQEAQSARLSHMQLQFTRKQLGIVEEAVSRIMPQAKKEVFNNPNARGNAIYLLCKFYLDSNKEEM